MGAGPRLDRRSRHRGRRTDCHRWWRYVGAREPPRRCRRLQVFNLTVAEDSSYFVGAERVWAHNATCTLRVRYPVPRSPSHFAIGASDGGPGAWSSITRPDNDAYRYQELITGAPRGVEYNVNGVNFDGYDANRDVLLDAKHWTQECPLGDRCRYEPLRQPMEDKLLEGGASAQSCRAAEHLSSGALWTKKWL